MIKTKCFLLVFLLCCIHCTTKKASMLRAHNFSKNAHTKIYLNDTLQPIRLDSIYLDTRNIDKIQFDKASNTIFVIQKNKDSKLLRLSDVALDTLSGKGKITAIILNDKPLTADDIHHIKIEESAIKSVTIEIPKAIKSAFFRRDTADKTLHIKTKR